MFLAMTLTPADIGGSTRRLKAPEDRTSQIENSLVFTCSFDSLGSCLAGNLTYKEAL
jgi:hypothetical protein